MEFVSSNEKQKSKKKVNNNILLEIIEDNITNNNNKNNNKIDFLQRLNHYKNCEYIPNDIINIVLEHLFTNYEILHNFTETHLVIKVKINNLLRAPIENWKYNRPPDMSRCPDIARYIYNSKKPIDTMLYLSYNNINQNCNIIDGIHRLTALRIIKEENSKPLDLIFPCEFGCNNDASWLYEQYILLNIKFNATEENLMETFKTLNKSQIVPDLYIRDYAKEKREMIEKIANEWQVRYKKHFSSTANPITGNTNRNKFIDLLDKIYDKYKIRDTKENILKQRLDDANNKISFNIPKKVSIDIQSKCKETGCYLFLHKNDKLEEII